MNKNYLAYCGIACSLAMSNGFAMDKSGIEEWPGRRTVGNEELTGETPNHQLWHLEHISGYVYGGTPRTPEQKFQHMFTTNEDGNLDPKEEYRPYGKTIAAVAQEYIEELLKTPEPQIPDTPIAFATAQQGAASLSDPQLREAYDKLSLVNTLFRSELGLRNLPEALEAKGLLEATLERRQDRVLTFMAFMSVITRTQLRHLEETRTLTVYGASRTLTQKQLTQLLHLQIKQKSATICEKNKQLAEQAAEQENKND